MTIGILCEHQLFADALLVVMASSFVQDQFETFIEIEDLLQRSAPDLLILDVSAKGYAGLAILEQCQVAFPGVRIICILSELLEEKKFRQAFRTGCVSLIDKNASMIELIEAIRQVKGGKPYLQKGLRDKWARKLLAKPVIELHFTRREKMVLEKVCSGLTIKEIAHELGLSKFTVQYYQRSVMRKLKVNRTVDLIVFAIQAGLYIPNSSHLSR